MIARGTKTTLYSHKTAILGLVFVLLIVIMLCGHIQLLGAHSASSQASVECNKTVFLTNHVPTKDNGILYLIIFSFIALAMFIKSGMRARLVSIAQSNLSITFLKVAQIIPKIFNPILEAFRRGILHPQIYNFAFITS